MKDPIDSDLVMVSYLKSGRCWWILRLYNDDTFDYYFSSTQPIHDEDVPRQRYSTLDIENVVSVGELKDWISGVIGKSCNLD
jgi:hypothetical protein